MKRIDMLLLKNLPLLFCLSIASGFRPNHESGGIDPSDFTDTDITEMGVLRAVAWYMERNPLPGKPPMTPGQLENMKPLTATGLFKAYFQADVSPNRFVKALQEIISGNNLVEVLHMEDSSFFFYCEEITKSINQLRILRDSVLSGLKGHVNSSALESARLSAGKALHVLQKFYSNTNWAEMGNSKPYEYLLNTTSRAFPAAPASKTTCGNCVKESGGWYSCDENLLVKDMLTSGYKLSTTCRTKPRDAWLKDEVKVLIDSTGSEVNYALTGYCSSRKRRSVAGEETEASATSYANPYEELAAYSGGYYVMTSKSQLSQILGIMKLSLNAAPAKVAHSRMDGARFSFPVDETLTEISVSVKSLTSSGFSMTVLRPSGATSASTVVINTANHKVVEVSPIHERGSWTVVVSPSGSYEVEIGGKSLMDFSYQIMQKQKEYVLPVQGRPVKGANYTFSMKVMGDAKGAEVHRLAYVSGQGNPIGSVALNQTSDAFGNILAVAPIILNAPTTLLIVEGLSPSGLPFSRVSAEPITTESVQILPLPGQNGTLSPGETLELSVVVVNDGPAASFSFKVLDDLGLMKSFRPTSSFLNGGENITLTATFMASGEDSSFASSIATFTAKSATAQNYLKLPVTVIPETALETDETPPVSKLLDFYMPCVGKLQQKPVCSGHSWRMRFSAKDAESAVTVRVNANPAGLTCSPRGTDGDKDLICHYLSDCCSPYAEVLMSDENGNTETLTIDYRRPRPSAA
nr:uncharacterized protein LOC132765687 [Anolis sagrei ordinatus]